MEVSIDNSILVLRQAEWRWKLPKQEVELWLPARGMQDREAGHGMKQGWVSLAGQIYG